MYNQNLIQRAWFVLIVFLPSVSLAIFPSLPGDDPWANRPNDPGYAGLWQYFSHLPMNHVGKIPQWERNLGSGMHVDRAWQYHTGTPETVVAILDSGIKWGARDLLERYYLNHRELPLPEGRDAYDANGDGRFSVSDYAGDSRVRDVNENGVVDPGDLIAVFSNSLDEDNNGFIDDIAGWDFHEHDNDPYDRTRFGHGTSEAEDSVAAVNNGLGGAGACGDCSVMFLRLNDSFIVDVNAFSRAVYYAADNGAVLVQQALGSMNYNPFTRDSIEYAYRKGVIIIGSAADENSYHHNYPSTLDPIVYPNAIRYDTPETSDATTFLNFNNCSNYGARVDVAVSGRFCSSEATGRLSGISALSWSYANALGQRLTPGELVSLIKTSATDVNWGRVDENSYRHSTFEGWDTITGYGRANALNMLKSIHEEKIPPSVRVLSPVWFEMFRESQIKSIPVNVEVPVPRSGKFTVRLEVAKGVETSHAEFKLIKQTNVMEEAIEGEFTALELSTLRSLKPGSEESGRNRFAYTIRVSVEDALGRSAEARRTFFLFDDPYLMKGFPKKLLGSGESPGFFMDLTGNGKEEYVTADGGGFIHAFKENGEELPGFPVSTAISRYDASDRYETDVLYSSIVAPIAGGDMDGDGRAEIVSVSLEGDISVVDSKGKMKKNFPITLPFPDMTLANSQQIISQGVLAAPVLADLNRNGKLEILIVGMDGRLHVYTSKGKPLDGFPVEVTDKDMGLAKLLSSPAVYDVDGDGILDILLGSNHFGKNNGFIFAVNGRGREGTPISGFPARIPILKDAILPTVGTGIPTSPAIGDINGDGKSEIIVHAFVGKTYAVSMSGQLVQSLSMKHSDVHHSNDTHMLSAFGHPAIGDIKGDGKLSPVNVGTGKRALVNMLLGGKRYDYDHLVGAWDGVTGNMITGFPKVNDDMTLAPSPVLSDLDNDGKAEILLGSGGYFVHAFSETGEAKGFPHFTGGWTFGSTSIGDVDGDGYVEVAASTREGYVFIWKTEGKVSVNKGIGIWPTFKANPQRTGSRESATMIHMQKHSLGNKK